MTQEEVYVNITNNSKYYSNLGYSIPRVFHNLRKQEIIAQGTKILVKTKDLPKNSCIRVHVTCDICFKLGNITYQKYIKSTNNYKRDYNCHKCASSKNAKKTIAKKGEKHHNWNKELTSGERAKRKEHRYTDDRKSVNWRTFIYKRDNYTCKNCKQTSKYLCAHHLNNWKHYLLERYDFDNGVTLCKFCHLEFHKKYGKCSTKEKFKEFLESYKIQK